MKDTRGLRQLKDPSRKDGVRKRLRARNFLRGLKPRMEDQVRFLGAFLRRPACVGALNPSSPALARAMIRDCVLKSCDTVVELGPGTGAFTGPILQSIGRNTTFIAMELDPMFARGLKLRYPSLQVYNDSAERLGDYLALHGKKSADYIISGLPWASLPLIVQNRIMEAVLSSLGPGGVFTTFGYLHARWLPNAQRFRLRLQQHFSGVATSSVVWKNFPPAFVYRCVK